MKFNKKSLLALAMLGMLVLGSGYGTYAYFTARAVSADNTIKAGTLELGGVMEGNDVEKQFAAVTFENIEPGETLEKVTKLKNVGDLPFYLYRITASDLVDNTPNNGKKDAILLDNVLTMNIKISTTSTQDGWEQVYHGKLSELKAVNGGYFDPIQEIESEDEKNMKISLSMDSNANNMHQGLSMSCSFTVYAAQEEMPIPGEPEGTKYDMGSSDSDLFSVEGWNDENWINFQWDWTTGNNDREAYRIKLKHETGGETTEYEEVIVTKNGRDDIDINMWSYDNISPYHVQFDDNTHTIKINKEAIPQGWETFEVQFGGNQGFSDGDNIEYQTIPYQQWSLNR